MSRDGDDAESCPFRVMYVNMDRSAVRRERLESELTRAGVMRWTTRIRGVDYKRDVLGAEPGSHNAQAVRLLTPHAIESATLAQRREHDAHCYGSVGCYLAHLDALCLAHERHAHDPDVVAVLVLEDDIHVKTKELRNLRRIIEADALPEDWDIISLNCVRFWHGRGLLPLFRPILPASRWTFKPRTQFLGTGAYIVRPSRIEALLRYLLPIDVQYDWQMSRMIAGAPDVRGFSAVPNMIAHVGGHGSEVFHTGVEGAVMLKGPPRHHDAPASKEPMTVAQVRALLPTVVISDAEMARLAVEDRVVQAQKASQRATQITLWVVVVLVMIGASVASVVLMIKLVAELRRRAGASA